MSVHTARDCEVSKGVVWVQLLLVSETSWPESLDAEIAQSPHAGVQASSPGTQFWALGLGMFCACTFFAWVTNKKL